MRMWTRYALLVFTGAALGGCGTTAARSDGGVDLAARGPDLAPACPGFTEDLTSCQPPASDYRPRANMSHDDAWPACPPDDDTFHLLGPGIPGSAARVVAFEEMGAQLWWHPGVPSAQDFLD